MDWQKDKQEIKILPDTWSSIAPHLEGSISIIAKHYGCQHHVKLLKDLLGLRVVQLVCEAEVMEGPHVGTKSECGIIRSLQGLSQHHPGIHWALEEKNIIKFEKGICVGERQIYMPKYYTFIHQSLLWFHLCLHFIITLMNSYSPTLPSPSPILAFNI